MATTLELMASGLPAQAAGFLGFGTTATGLSAAGTTSADATQLTAGINVLATVNSGEGVTLPIDPMVGSMAVINGGANAVLVYPGSGNQINDGTASTGSYSVANGKTALFFRCGTRILATLST